MTAVEKMRFTLAWVASYFTKVPVRTGRVIPDTLDLVNVRSKDLEQVGNVVPIRRRPGTVVYVPRKARYSVDRVSMGEKGKVLIVLVNKETGKTIKVSESVFKTLFELE